MLKIVVGHSDDPDSQGAVTEVLEQCIQELGGMVPKAGLLFAAIDFDHASILQQINQTFPNLQLVGCTTDGEISSIMGFQQDSLILTLFSSDTVEIFAGVGHHTETDAITAAHQAVQQATAQSQALTKLCITVPASYTSRGSTTSGEQILKGLELALGESVPIVGGTAGDQFRFKKTYQFFGTEVFTDALPILLFFGDLYLSHGVGCGWQPMGSKSTVTKAQGTVLYEVNAQSALEFYQKYLGDRPPTAEHPLYVYEGDSDRCYLRVPNTCDLEAGSINFLGNIPQGATVQLAEISRDEVIAASASSFKMALADYPGSEPEAVLVFSCCCRRWLLGTRAKEEYDLVKNALPKMMPIAGFYTYGEFAPLQAQGCNYYHQETFVTLLLGTA